MMMMMHEKQQRRQRELVAGLCFLCCSLPACLLAWFGIVIDHRMNEHGKLRTLMHRPRNAAARPSKNVPHQVLVALSHVAALRHCVVQRKRIAKESHRVSHGEADSPQEDHQLHAGVVPDTNWRGWLVGWTSRVWLWRTTDVNAASVTTSADSFVTTCQRDEVQSAYVLEVMRPL